MATGAPDYYKTALLAGMYGTAPVLAYITSDGRFVMRLEDWPDIWGEAGAMGLAELAAIFSPAKRYDRRGQVIYIDSFEAGLIMVDDEYSGTGAGIAVASDRARTGFHSCKLTAGSDGDCYSRIYHAIPYLSTSRFGIEISFTDHLDSEQHQLRGGINLRDGWYRFRLRYRRPEHDISYWDEDGNWQVIEEDVYLSDDNYMFHTAKLVFDAGSGDYVRWMVDNHTGSLAGVPGQYTVGLGYPAILFWFFVYSTAGKNAVSYVDDLIITQNEPE